MAQKRNFPDNAVSDSKKVCHGLGARFINYLSVPSLESISIVSITTVLFKQSVIIDAIQKHSIKYDSPESCKGTYEIRSLDKIENKIVNELVFLPLPDVLKVKVSNTVKPILLEILRWIKYRKDLEYIDSICWSNEGTVDKARTLKRLIDKVTDHNVKSIFQLACKYCLEESILELWNKLPVKIKEHYLCCKSIYKSYGDHLIAYWTHDIRRDLSNLPEKIRLYDKKRVYNFNDSINKNMFDLALFTGNILAVKYFWNKLACIEISCNLSHWIQLTIKRKVSRRDEFKEVSADANIIYFLLSKMTCITEQNEIIQNNSKEILNSLFFDWPWQRFLLPTINLCWEYIDENFYTEFLNNISYFINEKNTMGDLFGDLWSDSPINLKEYFINYVLKFRKTDVFCKLLIAEKVGTVKALLECANIEDRRKIIFLVAEDRDFTDVVHSEKLHLFEDLCTDVLSESEIKYIKESIACGKNVTVICLKWMKNNEWNKVNAFLNWGFDTEDRIVRFKTETLKKNDIMYSLLYPSGNYELANKFLSWCFDSEEKIHEFKIYFVKDKPEIVKIGCDDWQLFEKFVNWCFYSDEEVQSFRSYYSQTYHIWKIIYPCIAFGYQFDFIENLMKWCFESDERLKAFREALALSDTWRDLLQRFVSNYKVYDSPCNNWELIKKLLKLVSPLDEEVVVVLKERIASGIDFDNYRGDFSMFHVPKYPSVMVRKKDVFGLLDDQNYDMETSDDDDESDSGNSDDEQACDSDGMQVTMELGSN